MMNITKWDGEELNKVQKWIVNHPFVLFSYGIGTTVFILFFIFG